MVNIYFRGTQGRIQGFPRCCPLVRLDVRRLRVGAEGGVFLGGGAFLGEGALLEGVQCQILHVGKFHENNYLAIKFPLQFVGTRYGA